MHFVFKRILSEPASLKKNARHFFINVLVPLNFFQDEKSEGYFSSSIEEIHRYTRVIVVVFIYS